MSERMKRSGTTRCIAVVSEAIDYALYTRLASSKISMMCPISQQYNLQKLHILHSRLEGFA